MNHTVTELYENPDTCNVYFFTTLSCKHSQQTRLIKELKYND